MRPEQGQSLVPLFGSVPGPWRSEFLLEHMQHTDGGVPTYCGVHSDRYVYVRYRTDEEELYDLERDPAELVNGVERRGTPRPGWRCGNACGSSAIRAHPATPSDNP